MVIFKTKSRDMSTRQRTKTRKCRLYSMYCFVIYIHTFYKLDPCSSDKHTVLYMEAKMHCFRHCTWGVYAKNNNQGNISIAFLQTRFLLYESSVVLKAECKRNIRFICIENADRCIRGVKTKVKNEDRH